MRSTAFLSVSALCVLVSATAMANGRFPASQRLIEHPQDPNRLYMAATYGLLLTEDRGQSWHYVCENAFALGFADGDPMLEVLPDGAMLSGIFYSLNRSSDCGCSWQAVLASTATDIVLDVTRDSSGTLVAMVREATFPGTLRLDESSDGGRTWRKMTDFPTNITSGFTVDVAPSDPSRIYATVFASDLSLKVLLVSRDRGTSWQQLTFTGLSATATPYIAAVDRTTADKVYVRTDDWNDSAEFAARDGLLYSDDGGQSWNEVISSRAKLLGFALSPDGATVLVGYGDPIQPGSRTVDVSELGIYKASTADFLFDRIFEASISCLQWTATGLYACVTQNHPALPRPGLGLGFAPNANFTIAAQSPFTSLLDLRNVRGPLGCTASRCAQTWQTGVQGAPAVCQALEAPCDADPAANVLACSSGGADAGGAGGGGAGGGAGQGAGGARDGGGGTGAGGSGAGCGCSQGTRGGERPLLPLVLLLVSVVSIVRLAGCRTKT